MAIRHRVFVEGQGVPLEREHDGLDASSFHYLGFIDGVSVTTARVRRVNGAGKIERVAVLPEHERKGIGAMLMASIESDLMDKDVPVAVLSAQTSAQGFYEKLGYSAVGDIFEDAEMDHVHMYKLLLDINPLTY